MTNNRIIVRVALLAILFSTTVANAQVKTRTRTESNNNDYSLVNVETDSASATDRITMHKDGQVYKIKVVNDKITEIIIDGKLIPEADFPKYEPTIIKLREQLKKDQEQAVRDRAQAELDRQRADKDREQAERDRAQADRDRIQAEKDRKQADKDRAQAELDRKQADKDRAQAALDRVQAEKDRAQAARDRAQADIDRKQAEEDRQMLTALIDDLIKAGIVQRKEDLQMMQLSNDALIVNDQKQSAALHQQLKSRYLKSSNSSITYTNRNNNTRLNIERN